MRSLSIAIGLLLAFSFLGCNPQGEQEIYLLPKGYTGHILIILNQKNGAPVKYEAEARVYEIPQNGILRTQFSNNEGWANLPQFYYDRIDKQNQIPVKVDYNDISSDEVNATLPSTGTAYKNVHGTNTREINFTECYVGTKAQIEEASRQAEKISVADLVN
jgi:hypothetical protein